MNKLIMNPDVNRVSRIISAINKKNGHCPCQIEVSDSTLCPCDDFYNGECHCKLFIKKESDHE